MWRVEGNGVWRVGGWRVGGEWRVEGGGEWSEVILETVSACEYYYLQYFLIVC